MFTIPYTFANEDESYITLPALKRFAKEKRNEELKTTVDRPQLITDIENYADQSLENREVVLEWLDKVLVEGIKEVQIKKLEDSLTNEFLQDDEYVSGILEPLLVNSDCRHLCNSYSEMIKLYKYEIVNESENGRIIKLYFGKMLSTYDKRHEAALIPYPIFVEIYLDESIIVGRSKSKSGLYKYMENFVLEQATSTTAEKEINNAIKYACEILALQTANGFGVGDYFRKKLYLMLENYTKTPKEITDLMDAKKVETEKIVTSVMGEICNLSGNYYSDVKSNVLNMIEKYFSISYVNKQIFIKDREAYPLRLNATDEEESRVEQAAAMEEPLQSKAIFFDNKKMLQKSKACDAVVFAFNRINTLYCPKRFKVKIFVNRDFCTLKFTEYTMEEDIVHVLFSLIGATGITE